jgi:SAM-dependent methyltransferase
MEISDPFRPTHSKNVLPRRVKLAGVLCILLAFAAPLPAQWDDSPGDVPYVPTPQNVVDEMLELANVKKWDVVYDLGCGDGRIVITAARKYGARGVGVDINPERIEEAEKNAREAGVAGRVNFIENDLFKADIRQATVVMLYLLPDVNLRLRPKLLKELRPGTRIVSHSFSMGEWKADKTIDLEGRTLYLWVVTPLAKQDWGKAAEE